MKRQDENPYANMGNESEWWCWTLFQCKFECKVKMLCGRGGGPKAISYTLLYAYGYGIECWASTMTNTFWKFKYVRQWHSYCSISAVGTNENLHPRFVFENGRESDLAQNYSNLDSSLSALRRQTHSRLKWNSKSFAWCTFMTFFFVKIYNLDRKDCVEFGLVFIS